MAKWWLAWQWLCSITTRTHRITIVLCKFYYDFLVFTAVQGVFEVSMRNKKGKRNCQLPIFYIGSSPHELSVCVENPCGSGPRKVRFLSISTWAEIPVLKRSKKRALLSHLRTSRDTMWKRLKKKVHFSASTPFLCMRRRTSAPTLCIRKRVSASTLCMRRELVRKRSKKSALLGHLCMRRYHADTVQ